MYMGHLKFDGRCNKIVSFLIVFIVIDIQMREI